jgi:hypothetical protein
MLESLESLKPVAAKMSERRRRFRQFGGVQTRMRPFWASPRSTCFTNLNQTSSPFLLTWYLA